MLRSKHFKAALCRLGLKVGDKDNLDRAYRAFSNGRSALDIYTFASEVEQGAKNFVERGRSAAIRVPSVAQRAPSARAQSGVGMAPAERPKTGASVTTVRPFG